MGLIHWWPLNGDTRDHGLQDVTLSNSNGTVSNNGKIGKCYYLSHSAGFTGLFNTNALMSNECSFALWIMIPETEYKARVNAFSYDSDHILMNSRIFGTSGSYSDTGLCLALQTNNIYGSGSFSSISLCMGWRDASSASVWDEYTINLNTWYHVVITKAADRKMCMYVNGIKVCGPSQASAGTFPDSYFYINSGAVWGGGYYRNSNAPMFINDFRIYDHALSATEVHEISKGLILHYNFEDLCNPNLLINAKRYTSTSKMASTSSSADGYQHWPVYCNNLQNSTTYTLTVDLDGTLSNGHGRQDDDISKHWCTIWLYFSNSPYSDTDYGWYTLPVCFTSANYNHKQLSATRHQWTFILGSDITYYTCCNIRTNTYSDNSTTITVNYWNLKLEAADTVTPFTTDGENVSTVYDNSGYGYNGFLVGDCQLVSDTKAGTRALFNHGLGLDNYTESGKAFVLGDLKNEMSPAQLTISFWANIIATFANHSGIISLSMSDYWPTDYQDSGLAQYDAMFRVNTTDGSPSVSQNISFNEWHHYALVYNGATLDLYKDGTWVTGTNGTGVIKPFRYLFLGLNGAGGMWRKSQIKWGNFKMYATALSAADIQSEYQRKAAITKNGTVFTSEIAESSLTNLMDITSYGIATQTWTTGLSNYTQANCQVSLTADGYRIYRTPNHDGQAIEGHGWDNWGGMRLMPLSIDANLLKKYHRYILKWHVKGQTCDGITGYWTNNMGWGGGGLDPSPSNVETVDIPSGFIGEKDCYYRFTINDDVYKVCTTSYAGFVQGETYPSYQDFAFGCGYSYTNELGTDLYITNIRLYDITNLTEQEIQILTSDVVKCEDIYEAPDNNIRFEKSRTVSAVQFIEN